MNYERRQYGHGTSTVQSAPWGFYRSARVMCSDGVVRATARISETADTFFSVPCAVKVRGRTVSGYLTIETAQGYSTETDGDPAVVKFNAYTYGRNADALPAPMWKQSAS